MCLAIPAKILKLEGSCAQVDFGGVRKKISLGIIDHAREGDFVLVHAGFAIGKVSPAEAQKTLQAIAEIKEILES